MYFLRNGEIKYAGALDVGTPSLSVSQFGQAIKTQQRLISQQSGNIADKSSAEEAYATVLGAQELIQCHEAEKANLQLNQAMASSGGAFNMFAAQNKLTTEFAVDENRKLLNNQFNGVSPIAQIAKFLMEPSLASSVKKVWADVIMKMLEIGCDANAVNARNNQNSLLHYAGAYANTALIKELINRGADKTSQNLLGRTPFEMIPEGNRFSRGLLSLEAPNKKENCSIM